MDIRIIVAAHKPYWMPAEKPYLPVQVGAAGKESISPDWARDDTGVNISEKNAAFCELTGLYWAWKNLNADAYGLCHYRRYLSGRNKEILSDETLGNLLTRYDLVLPVKRHYWIETRESQYVHAHHSEDLACVARILAERYAEYLPAWRHMLKARSGHICNMFVMKKPDFEKYCAWLFDILFEAERRLDISTYTSKDQRVFGYLAERLLDVWIETNQKTFVEVPVLNLERQHWVRKGFEFLKRKYSSMEKD